jgi:DNA-binding HxlR family transcriptional regulator
MAAPQSLPTHPSRRDIVRSECPVACTLDVVGDRWSLLIVRDLLAGKHRYGELLASAEGIPTNILAERLRRFEREGLIERVAYSSRPPRFEYQLTQAGRELGSALLELARWGLRHVPGTRPPAWLDAAALESATGGTRDGDRDPG